MKHDNLHQVGWIPIVSRDLQPTCKAPWEPPHGTRALLFRAKPPALNVVLSRSVEGVFCVAVSSPSAVSLCFLSFAGHVQAATLRWGSPLPPGGVFLCVYSASDDGRWEATQPKCPSISNVVRRGSGTGIRASTVASVGASPGRHNTVHVCCHFSVCSLIWCLFANRLLVLPSDNVLLDEPLPVKRTAKLNLD